MSVSRANPLDGASAWAVFRHVQLPKMKHVLTIAVLLRVTASSEIYTALHSLSLLAALPI